MGAKEVKARVAALIPKLEKATDRDLLKIFEESVLNYELAKTREMRIETRESLTLVKLELVRRLHTRKAAIVSTRIALERWCALEDPSSCGSDIPAENEAVERLTEKLEILIAAER